MISLPTPPRASEKVIVGDRARIGERTQIDDGAIVQASTKKAQTRASIDIQ